MSATMEWPRKWRLGVPYQGSKNQIAREIISILPRGKRFVDLFAGGCAMTHAALISGKYDAFLVNDLHGFGVRLFMDAIAGKCNGRWKEWVSREEFFEKRDKDPLIALCWSFGNKMNTYLFGREIEEEKKELHERIVKSGSYREWMRGRSSSDSLPNLERQQALERLEALERSYDDYIYNDGDVVVCDPPYEGTADYDGVKFDNSAFWQWVDSRDYCVFVCEYKAPCGFTPIWTKGKQQMLCAKSRTNQIAERVFVADRYADKFQTDLFLGVK